MSDKLVVPQYTAEDYDGEAPYKWLYEHRNDKFLLKRLTKKMKEQAGSVGVTGFIGMFNAYCESMAAAQGTTLERTLDFEGQPIHDLLSGDYIGNENGVYMLDKFGYEVPVCRHPILPICRLINADTGEERLEIAYRPGREWRTIVVEKSIIASGQKIIELSDHGVNVNSDNAKMLSTYLFAIEQLNYEVIPEQRSIGRLGWIKDHGFSPYVDNLAFDGDTKYKDVFEAIKPVGDFQTWLKAVRRVRAEKTVARIFLASSFASVLIEPCGLLPFFVHAWGGQGSGKTVGMMIAASVWACPKMGDYVKTFDATEVGQEKVAAFLNSLPLCLDELQIEAAGGRKDFDKMIYKLTEGVGRIRGSKNGGIQQMAKWKNCMLTTGEDPIINPNSMGGATARVIEFECTETFYSDLLGILDVINHNYGFAGKLFVEYLQTDGAIEKTKAIQKEYYRRLLEGDGTDKQAASASVILAADSVATDLIFKDGNNLTVEDMEQFITHKDAVNINTRALEYIYELVARNPLHFQANEYGEYKQEVWGVVEPAYTYIIKSVFDREMANAGYNATSFLSWAYRNELLDCDDQNAEKKVRKTKVKRIGVTTVRTVGIKSRGEENPQTVEFTEVSDDDELPF